ncbi:hypothetical protein PT974_04960 [Cladobotryum mycophilum]|uniref:N-acetyltransferase domain-containing protein n=1 Tax=Cladobotryum mycophilum TaxID=491253 RepID=A0ABR0SQN4_9HYPO
MSTHMVAGGTVAVTLARLGLKLDVVLGIGMAGPVSGDDLRTIEGICSSIGLPTLIGLCLYVHLKTLETLAARNYHVAGFLNEYVRTLEDINIHDSIESSLASSQKDSGATISHVQPHDHEEFVKCSADGFKDSGRSFELLSTLARITLRRSDTVCFVVKVNSEVASTDALALVETAYGLVGFLYLGSTIHKYRNRGLHYAPNRARLLEARKQGCRLAIVEIWLGNASGRNAERIGFRVVYTRTWLQRGCLNSSVEVLSLIDASDTVLAALYNVAHLSGAMCLI